MTKHLTATTAAGAAVLALAAAAPAKGAGLPLPSDPRFAVAAGKLERTVTVERVSGAKAVPSHTRTEAWITRDRSHTIVTDLRTGTIRAETLATPASVRIYTAEDGAIRVERRAAPGGLPVTSAAFEAAVQRAYVERGIARVVGETVVGGRRALVTEFVGARRRGDEPGTRTTATVDAETFALLARETEHAGGLFRQTQRVIVTETLSATARAVRRAMTMRVKAPVKVRSGRR